MSDLTVKAEATGAGRTIYDDGVARAADIGGDRFLLECAGRSIESGALELVEAATALIRHAGGKLSILESVRATLEDIEARIPVDG